MSLSYSGKLEIVVVFFFCNYVGWIVNFVSIRRNENKDLIQQSLVAENSYEYFQNEIVHYKNPVTSQNSNQQTR